MGQANRRGTYEARKAAALLKAKDPLELGKDVILDRMDSTRNGVTRLSNGTYVYYPPHRKVM